MKPLIVALAVVLNFAVVVLYSRGLAGGTPEGAKAEINAATESPASTPSVVSEVASAPDPAPVTEEPQREVSGEVAGQPAKSTVALEPVRSGDGKEMLDSKDGKELRPVAEGARPLGFRLPINRAPRETLPGSADTRGILAPANRANLDPPIVSPEAR